MKFDRKLVDGKALVYLSSRGKSGWVWVRSSRDRLGWDEEWVG